MTRSAVAAREERILSRQCMRPDGAFDRVGVLFDAAVVKEPDQAAPVAYGVTPIRAWKQSRSTSPIRPASVLRADCRLLRIQRRWRHHGCRQVGGGNARGPRSRTSRPRDNTYLDSTGATLTRINSLHTARARDAMNRSASISAAAPAWHELPQPSVAEVVKHDCQGNKTRRRVPATDIAWCGQMAL